MNQFTTPSPITSGEALNADELRITQLFDAHTIHTLTGKVLNVISFARAIEAAALTASTAPAPVAQSERDAWISVDERLPEPMKDRLFSDEVLAVNMDSDYPGVLISRLHYEVNDGRIEPTVWQGMFTTHWMPKPALPAIAAQQPAEGAEAQG